MKIKVINPNTTASMTDKIGAAARAAASPGTRITDVAAGTTTTLGDFVHWAAEKAPGFRAEVVVPSEADIFQDDSLRDGAWGAYDISRVFADTGWKPRPVREAFHAYIDWLAERREAIA